MATLTDQRASESQFEHDPTTEHAPKRPSVWPQRLRTLAMLVLIVGVIAGGAYAASKYFGKTEAGPRSNMLLHAAKRGDLLVTVTEDGNVESAENVEVRCQVAGGSSILWIIKDGEVVSKGDKLVELDKAQLEEQINTQRITFEKARSAVTQAEKDFSVATISVQEYLEGTFKKEIQDAEAQITISLENLRSAQNSLEYSQRMFRKGYVSSLDLESAQFAVQRCQLELDSANTAKEVLEKFTKVKTLEDLQSKVETARAKMESEKAAFQLEQTRLKRLESQIENCVITAPEAGMVVYANDASRMRMGGQQGPQIEEGAQVRERQAILRLPDLTKMQVKVNIHETKVDSIRRGMPALINIQGRELKGHVKDIANQPEPSSWFSATVKEYATLVSIDGDSQGLKPGMTAEVEILLKELKDVVMLPVAAIVEQRNQHFCWVKKADKLERRPLVLGGSNDQFVEVTDGVSEGEQVVLNPRAVVEEARAADETGPAKEGEAQESGSKFGEAKADAATAKGAAPAGGPEQPAAGGAQKGPPGAGAPPGGGGPGRGGPGGAGGFNLMSNDKDGDGKISKEEAPKFMQSFFDRVDTNSDGFIDESENQAMRQRAAAGGRGGGPGGGFGNLMSNDKDGDGKLSKDEAPSFMQTFFDRLDTNSDGFVEQSELDEARARMQNAGGGGGGPPQ